MFSSLGWPEVAILIVLGLFVFGPERLPQLVGDLARGVRRLRSTASAASAQLREELALDQLARDVRRDFGLDDDLDLVPVPGEVAAAVERPALP